MPPSPPQVFNGVTPDQYARLVEKAKAAGINLVGNSGTTSQYGVEVSWNYSPETQTLTLQVLKTPFFINADDANARLRKVVEQSLA